MTELRAGLSDAKEPTGGRAKKTTAGALTGGIYREEIATFLADLSYAGHIIVFFRA